MVPSAFSPVVVLILQLNPTDTVDLLVNKLLVAGGTILRSFKQALAESIDMVRWVGANQEISQKTVQRTLILVILHLKHIATRLGDDVMGVAFEVRSLNTMTGQTRNPFLVTD